MNLEKIYARVASSLLLCVLLTLSSGCGGGAGGGSSTGPGKGGSSVSPASDNALSDIPSDSEIGSILEKSRNTPSPGAAASYTPVFKATSIQPPVQVRGKIQYNVLSGTKYFLPRQIFLTEGSPAGGFAAIHFIPTAGRTRFSCLYEGNGNSLNAGACGSNTNGDRYLLKYCMRTEDFQNLNCGNNFVVGTTVQCQQAA